MLSRKLTCVAVLRTELGLTVEGFANLIGKSISAVNSLETGRLALSEETAFKIQQQTGVEMAWLLKGNPKEKPYAIDETGQSHPYTKEIFELIQAGEQPWDLHENVTGALAEALGIAVPWVSIYATAREAGKAQLAAYLMRDFLENLRQRLGADDKLMVALNKNAKIITDGAELTFRINEETGKAILAANKYI
jgi:transcriptional regulator with XRE-family HTH domain